jgi:T4-like virus tail tube protein gp19
MAFNINEFRAQLIGDGARPNLFQVNLTYPSYVNGDMREISFMAKAAQLPGSTVGTANLFYFGREMKFAGNRTFPDWTITIVNDENFTVRNSFEEWLDYINSHSLNVRDLASATPLSYTTDATVTQYSKTGDPIKAYNFVGMFPTDVSPIDLDWGTNDSIEEFTVTFAYQYWEDLGVSAPPTTS